MTIADRLADAVAQLDLWPNQTGALATCSRYLTKPDRSALVQMPTGTGKTGVIAVIATCVAREKPVLVVSPSQALSDQLRRDVAQVFWDRVKAPPGFKPERVLHLLPSNAAVLIDELTAAPANGRVVVVGTLQALQQIRADEPACYGALKRYVGVVLVDEGHREPAREWALAVRGLEQPTTLFSATPYRSDLRSFDVSEDHVFFLSFREALADHLIRDVRFVEVSSRGDAKSFAQVVLDRYDQLKAAGDLEPDAKVIVRCATAATVTAVCAAFEEMLTGRGEGCLAVHEDFVGGTGPRMVTVPDLRSRDEVFLIHQFKLTEGIDDSRCQMLALYQNFGNERQLVQQIGRIIRHPSPRVGMTKDAIVLAEGVSAVERMWHKYLKFDDFCLRNGRRPPSRDHKTFLGQLLDILPDADYIDRRFRDRADFDDPSIEDEIVIPKSCIVYRVDGTFDPSAFGEHVERELDQDDRELLSTGGNGNYRYYLSLGVRQSRFLRDSFYPEFDLHATVFAHADPYVMFYDSGGLWVDEGPCLGGRVEAVDLRRLIPQDRQTTLTSMSVLNGDIGPSSIRSRMFVASSLARTVPFMGDHTNFVSRATGRVGTSRRYVGFTRSRVREAREREKAEGVSLPEFGEWATEVAAHLQSGRVGALLFDRFAQPRRPPADPTPRNVLLDVAGIDEEFVDAGGTELIVEESCVDIGPSANGWSSFGVVANGTSYPAEIRFDDKKKKYIIRSNSMDAVTVKDKPKTTLTNRLNSSQSFRIIPATPGYIYGCGQFYGIDVRLSGAGTGSTLLSLLYAVDELGRLNSEKGTGGVREAPWGADGVFRMIDDALCGRAPTCRLAGLYSFTDLVCDDLGDEMADFIAMSETDGVVAFMHAKCADKAGVSASALYDVCAQTTKNLAYLRFGAERFTGTPNNWNAAWNGGPKSTYSVTKRIRSGGKTSAEFRRKLAELLGHPLTRREAWMVLGNTLSRDRLAREMRAPSVKPEMLQMAYLLMSTYSACKSVGVELRVFCSP